MSVAGRALRLRFQNGAPQELEHWEYDTFRTPRTGFDAPSPVRFTPDGSGRVASVELYGVTFTRAADEEDKHD